jgi:hypothetical protein
MTSRHWVIGSRPLEPWIWIHCSLETSGTDYVVTRRYTPQSGALKSWSDLAKDVANRNLQLLKWRREGRGHCKVPSKQSESRKSRSSDGILNWIRSECVVTELNCMLKSGRTKLLITTSVAQSGPKYSVHVTPWFYLVTPLFTICLQRGCLPNIVMVKVVQGGWNGQPHTGSHTWMRTIAEFEILGRW